jgi:hypothetical protein
LTFIVTRHIFSNKMAELWYLLLQVHMEKVLVVKPTMAVPRKNEAIRPTWFWKDLKNVRNLKSYIFHSLHVNLRLLKRLDSWGPKWELPINGDLYYTRRDKTCFVYGRSGFWSWPEYRNSVRLSRLLAASSDKFQNMSPKRRDCIVTHIIYT